jgi:uncharacterized membrane protein
VELRKKEGNEMATFEQSIDVNVPVEIAYNQWTQFETFPLFMEGVEDVQQITDSQLHWRAEIAGSEQEWDAEITEQTPDQRIAWTSRTGAKHAGVVTFHRLDDNMTRIMLQIEYDPEGFIENVGAALGVVKGRMKGDLENFKSFIESRENATGAWRGTIEQEH